VSSIFSISPGLEFQTVFHFSLSPFFFSRKVSVFSFLVTSFLIPDALPLFLQNSLSFATLILIHGVKCCFALPSVVFFKKYLLPYWLSGSELL
jgi:hypothetical protein